MICLAELQTVTFSQNARGRTRKYIPNQLACNVSDALAFVSHSLIVSDKKD